MLLLLKIGNHVCNSLEALTKTIVRMVISWDFFYHARQINPYLLAVLYTIFNEYYINNN